MKIAHLELHLASAFFVWARQPNLHFSSVLRNSMSVVTAENLAFADYPKINFFYTLRIVGLQMKRSRELVTTVGLRRNKYFGSDF